MPDKAECLETEAEAETEAETEGCLMQGMKPITAKNHLYECWAYRRDVIGVKFASTEFSDMTCVILHMLDSQKFFLDPAFARHGVPMCFKEIFRTSCVAGKITFEHSKKSWMNVLFRFAKRDPLYGKEATEKELPGQIPFCTFV